MITQTQEELQPKISTQGLFERMSSWPNEDDSFKFSLFNLLLSLWNIYVTVTWLLYINIYIFIYSVAMKLIWEWMWRQQNGTWMLCMQRHLLNTQAEAVSVCDSSSPGGWWVVDGVGWRAVVYWGSGVPPGSRKCLQCDRKPQDQEGSFLCIPT